MEEVNHDEGPIPTPTPADLIRFSQFIALPECRRRDDCWEWNGYRNHKGYGQFRLQGQTHYAHRVSFTVFNGDIPEGETVNHRCHNSSCVNPSHLEVMSVSENAKERHVWRADNNGNSLEQDYGPPPF